MKIDWCKIITFISIACETYSYDFCRTPNGELGHCIPTNYCKPILDVLRWNPSVSNTNFAINSRCGYQGYFVFVCCGSVGHYSYLHRPPTIARRISSNTNGRYIYPNIVTRPTPVEFTRPKPFIEDTLVTSPVEVTRPIPFAISTSPDSVTKVTSFTSPIEVTSIISPIEVTPFTSPIKVAPFTSPVEVPHPLPLGFPLASMEHMNLYLLPSENKCGLQALSVKIFGGEEVKLEDFPWMVQLEYIKNGRSNGHRCGGALISDRYVLTAAHCIVGEVVQEVGNVFRVRLGDYDVTTNPDCVLNAGTEDCNEPYRDVFIEKAIAHPGYNDIHRYHDIGLLRLKSNIIFNQYVKPICLPINGERSNYGENLTIAGWGLTEYSKYGSNVKLKANVPLFPDDECRRIFFNISKFQIQLSNNQFCAGGVAGIDSCRGDSGGPAMRTFLGKLNYYVEGTISFGHRMCGSPGIPGVYTKVSQYITWILDNIKP